MQRSAILGFLAGVAVTAAVGGVVIAERPVRPPPPPPAAANRYQMSTTANGTVYVFDSATGHLWIWNVGWTDTGSPPAAK